MCRQVFGSNRIAVTLPLECPLSELDSVRKETEIKKSRFSEEQIIAVVKEHAAGIGVTELCRKHGISDVTFCTWRQRYGGMEVSDANDPAPEKWTGLCRHSLCLGW